MTNHADRLAAIVLQAHEAAVTQAQSVGTEAVPVAVVIVYEGGEYLTARWGGDPKQNMDALIRATAAMAANSKENQ